MRNTWWRNNVQLNAELASHISTNHLREIARAYGLKGVEKCPKAELVKKVVGLKKTISIAIRIDTPRSEQKAPVVLGNQKKPPAKKKGKKKGAKPAEKKDPEILG